MKKILSIAEAMQAKLESKLSAEIHVRRLRRELPKLIEEIKKSK